MDTLLCLTWRTSKDLLSSTGNSAQCHVAAWIGGEVEGEMCICVCMVSPCAGHLKLNHNIVNWLYSKIES